MLSWKAVMRTFQKNDSWLTLMKTWKQTTDIDIDMADSDEDMETDIDIIYDAIK